MTVRALVSIVNTAWRVRTLRQTTLLAVVALSVTSPAVAQTRAERYDYWALYPSAVRSVGASLVSPDRSKTAELTRLGELLLNRGQLYLDLYEFDRVIMRDFARARDSVGRNGGTASPAATYFLARSLQELGDVQGAAAAYRRIPTSAPAALREQARVWAGTLGSGGGTGWQRDLLSWRAGKDITAPVACGNGVPICDMFQALATGNIGRILAAQGALAALGAQEYREQSRIEGTLVTIDYHDPVLYWLLAQADFQIAAHLLKGMPSPLAAIAPLFAGRPQEALPLLNASSDPAGRPGFYKVYVGQARFRSGDKVGAEREWKDVSGVTLNRLADVRASLGLPPTLAESQFRRVDGEGLMRFRVGRDDGDALARALLRHGRTREAVLVMEHVRPISLGTKLDQVRPEWLVLLAHARYLEGLTPGRRDLHTFARGDFAELATRDPLLRPLLQMLQVLTTPSVTGGAGHRST